MDLASFKYHCLGSNNLIETLKVDPTQACITSLCSVTIIVSLVIFNPRLSDSAPFAFLNLVLYMLNLF